MRIRLTALLLASLLGLGGCGKAERPTPPTPAAAVHAEAPEQPHTPSAEVQAQLPDIGGDTGAFQGLAADDRRELEAASAEQLVTIYLNAINQKEYDKAVACVDNRFISAADEPRFREYLTRTTAISDIIIHQYKTEDVAGPSPYPPQDTGLHFAVTYREVSDLSPNGSVAEKFFSVVRDSENGRWRIRGIGTGP